MLTRLCQKLFLVVNDESDIGKELKEMIAKNEVLREDELLVENPAPVLKS